MLAQILQSEPAYRLKQIYQAWFDPKIKSYGEITTLSKDLRAKLADEPWLGVSVKAMQESVADDTKKALLQFADGECVETVLMGRIGKKLNNDDRRYTICISTQAGCPMNCAFCATGKGGFRRNLTAEEIVDQVRFWMQDNKIDNIVLMGQGEPLLNYDNVKSALNIILDNTDIGPSKITLSTCGVPAGMEKMIADKNFPQVRFALSLHSAIDETRKKIMPSHQPGFFDFLIDWSRKYHEAIPSRTHFIGLEYTLLAGINDDAKHLKALIKLASKLGRVRINLIPYNDTGIFRGSSSDTVHQWHTKLMESGFTSTVRRSQGQDISAACGQLSLGKK